MKHQTGQKTILYVGGFQLPDKNAAAFRVMGNAKALRDCGYKVVFLNALIDTSIEKPSWTEYEGFDCYEYKRESQKQYLLSCKKITSIINEAHASIVIAYNYPAIALNHLRKYCQNRGIKCIADATEWYIPTGNFIFRLAKGLDTEFRMRYIQPRMDGVIAISEFLYQYYKDKVKTVKIPPLVDLNEEKWKNTKEKTHKGVNILYAGSPSAQKEKLDLIVEIIEKTDPSFQIHLDVVGITKEQFNAMYKCKYSGNKCSFFGKIPNTKVIMMTKEADWTIIIRENNKVVRAGFPTKVVESISCGAPVISNKFSNVEDYLNEKNSILVEDTQDILNCIDKIQNKKVTVNKSIFAYYNYLTEIKEIVSF